MDRPPIDKSAKSKASPHVRFVDEFIKRVPRGSVAGLFVMQLDKFNRIGTSFGRSRADELCAAFVEKLRSFLPEGSPVIRLAERHIAALVVGGSVGAVYQVANAVIRQINPRLTVRGDTFNVSSNLGLAYYPEHAVNGSNLFRRAELALSHAKEADLGLAVYEPDATTTQRTLWKFESDLQQAIKERRLEVLFQPKYDLASRRIHGAEALVRWRNDAGVLVSAKTFVPAAERTGTIVPITWIVFDRVAERARSWSRVAKPFSISVNVPAQALQEPEFMGRVGRLKSALDEQHVDLTLELTEEGLVRGDAPCLARLAQLRELGIGIAIDDFGKGYSSLNYLKKIPATEMKIDQAFVATIAVDERDEHIVKTTIDLAHAFDMHVVAEDVDSAESLQLLQELGCESVQGHFVARPMDADVLAEWIGKDAFGSIKRALDKRKRHTGTG